MSGLGAGKDKEQKLAIKMLKLGIKEGDLKEKFIRAQGPGGQKVNKSSTCVYLKHIPSGIEVKCQKERYQGLNRYRARQILAAKIEARMLGLLSEEQRRIAKLRRQKGKRSKRAKLKILEQKRLLSQKKRLRAKISEDISYEDRY